MLNHKVFKGAVTNLLLLKFEMDSQSMLFLLLRSPSYPTSISVMLPGSYFCGRAGSNPES